jgi:signal transduction histidine kinase
MMIHYTPLPKNFLHKSTRFFGIEQQDREEALRRLLSWLGLLLTFPILLAFGAEHWRLGDYFLGGFLLAVGSSFSVCFFFFRKVVNTAIIISLLLAAIGLLFLFLFVTSGPYGYMALWLYIFPPAVFFMLGLRMGSLYSLLLLSGVIVFPLFSHFFPDLAPHTPAFKVRFSISLFVVSGIAFLYELTQEKYKRSLKERQHQLEEEKAKLSEAVAIADQANMAKSAFLANMSHELRTPLNHIIGFTELVVDEQSGDLNAEQKEYLTDVLKSSRHLLTLINDILDLSKMEAGKVELEPGEMNLRTLLESGWSMVQERSQPHRLRVSTDLNRLPENFRGDERKIKQVLYNLLSNAVKFTPDGGTIRLSGLIVSNKDKLPEEGGVLERRTEQPVSAPEGSHVQISVIDSGIGIEPKDLERIFAPFVQVDSSASRKYEGTGLGLSLARRIVELHGGRIWAESRGLGQGSVFHFILPILGPGTG